MNHRTLGSVGSVSEVGYGAWQIGGDWGDVSESEAISAVEAARDAGIDFFDTADVYGDGRSERIPGDVLAEDLERDAVSVARRPGADSTPTSRRGIPRRTSGASSTDRVRTSGSTGSTSSSFTARRRTSTTSPRRSTPSRRSWTRGGSPTTASASSASRRG